MTFRIHDVTVHLMAAGAPGACTCGPASPIQKPGCPGGGASGPKPPDKPRPKGTAKPVPPGGDKEKRKGLAFLRNQLRETLASPAP